MTEADVNLFERLATHNFEVVLSALSVSATIVDALNYNTDFLIERSDSIRRALIAAVHHVHLPWVSFTEASKAGIANAFAEYEFVYSTNYDLLAYWAVMHSPRRFKDFFWGEEFDVTNTKIWGKCTKVLYLHGGLHLYRTPRGQTLKRSAEPNQNLLDLFGQPFRNATPLFVSEGSAEEKKASIDRSDYLSFALSQFSQDAFIVVILIVRIDAERGEGGLGGDERHAATLLVMPPDGVVALGADLLDQALVEQALEHVARGIAFEPGGDGEDAAVGTLAGGGENDELGIG